MVVENRISFASDLSPLVPPLLVSPSLTSFCSPEDEEEYVDVGVCRLTTDIMAIVWCGSLIQPESSVQVGQSDTTPPTCTQEEAEVPHSGTPLVQNKWLKDGGCDVAVCDDVDVDVDIGTWQHPAMMRLVRS